MKTQFAKWKKFLKWDVIRWVWAALSLALLVWSWEIAAKDPVYAVVGVVIAPPALAAFFLMFGVFLYGAGLFVWYVVSGIYKFCRDVIKMVQEYRVR